MWILSLRQVWQRSWHRASTTMFSSTSQSESHSACHVKSCKRMQSRIALRYVNYLKALSSEWALTSRTLCKYTGSDDGNRKLASFAAGREGLAFWPRPCSDTTAETIRKIRTLLRTEIPSHQSCLIQSYTVCEPKDPSARLEVSWRFLNLRPLQLSQGLAVLTFGKIIVTPSVWPSLALRSRTLLCFAAFLQVLLWSSECCGRCRLKRISQKKQTIKEAELACFQEHAINSSILYHQVVSLL